MREFTVIIEQDDEGWLIGSVPELKGCHTQAKTIESLMERIKEAIELCLEVEQDEGKSTRFVGVHRIAV